MKVYLKYDNSKDSKNFAYYFSDGGANISENMTYAQAVKYQYFLKTIGITVEDRSH